MVEIIYIGEYGVTSCVCGYWAQEDNIQWMKDRGYEILDVIDLG